MCRPVQLRPYPLYNFGTYNHLIDFGPFSFLAELAFANYLQHFLILDFNTRSALYLSIFQCTSARLGNRIILSYIILGDLPT